MSVLSDTDIVLWSFEEPIWFSTLQKYGPTLAYTLTFE